MLVLTSQDLSEYMSNTWWQMDSKSCESTVSTKFLHHDLEWDAVAPWRSYLVSFPPKYRKATAIHCGSHCRHNVVHRLQGTREREGEGEREGGRKGGRERGRGRGREREGEGERDDS